MRVQRASFVFTVLFMLLGPVKIVAPFSRLTRAADRHFKRRIAVTAALIASGIVLVVVSLGGAMVARYEISFDAVRLAAGLVMLLSALRVVFPVAEPVPPSPASTALALAMSPVAMPIVVPPAGIAVILVFVLLAPRYPGIEAVLALALLTMMLIDFLVMFFIDAIESVPGVLLVLQVFGAALIFVQVALAIETLLGAFRSLGVVR